MDSSSATQSARSEKHHHTNQRRQPNFFFGVRIDPNSVDGVSKKLSEIQLEMCLNSKEALRCMIPASKFHITLFVLYVESNEQLEMVGDILEDCRELLADYVASTAGRLDFSGVGQFGNGSIIYASLAEQSVPNQKFIELCMYKVFYDRDSSLVVPHINWPSWSDAAMPALETISPFALADELPMTLFSFSPIPNRSSRRRKTHQHGAKKFEFTPHITLFKARSPKDRKALRLHFCADLLARFSNSAENPARGEFGSSAVQSIDLLEMKGSRDGYYVKYSNAILKSLPHDPFVQTLIATYNKAKAPCSSPTIVLDPSDV